MATEIIITEASEISVEDILKFAYTAQLPSPSQLSDLNEKLATRSYIQGYAPTTADVAVLDSLDVTNIDNVQYPHLDRWFRHITSFSACQRKRWPPASSPEEVKQAEVDKAVMVTSSKSPVIPDLKGSNIGSSFSTVSDTKQQQESAHS